jgi:chromosomal replication initiation ATPase DnaA
MQASTSQIAGGAVLTAADVRVRAAQVRTFRARMWPPQRPAILPAPTVPALPMPASQDIDALRARLLALAPTASPGRITVRRVLEVTAGHFGTTVEALLSERRTQSLSRPRQIAMFVARKLTGRSLPFIGRRMGDRDHTTILHGWRAVQSLIDSGDAGTIATIVRIIEQLTEEAH